MFQRVTISAKIFGIAVGLVLIGGVVAAISARMTSLVSEQLRVVTENYMPAYVALSDADGAAGDENLWLRRLFSDYDEGTGAPAPERERILGEVRHQEKLLDGSIADARLLINRQIVDPFAFDDDVALARLDERLSYLQKGREAYRAVLPKLIDALSANRRDEVKALLPRIEAYRDRFNDAIDADRMEMQRLS